MTRFATLLESFSFSSILFLLASSIITISSVVTTLGGVCIGFNISLPSYNAVWASKAFLDWVGDESPMVFLVCTSLNLL